MSQPLTEPDPEVTDALAGIDRLCNECFECGRDKRDKSTRPCDYCKPPPKYPRMAPDGQIFVCGACGKVSKDLYGDKLEGLGSWDESCMLNAVLCHEKSVVLDGGRVIKADAVEGY